QLFAGGNIASCNGQFRLRDKDINPLRKFSYSTYFRIRKLLRKDNHGYLVLDKNKVRQQSGHTWVKKYYQSLKTKQ
ncbi:MAG: hypothetical protein ABL876_17105, partial [Chitinophagaceae bacterium]